MFNMGALHAHLFCIFTTVLLSSIPLCQGKKTNKLEAFKKHNQTFDEKLQGVFALPGDPADHLTGKGRLEGEPGKKPLQEHIKGGNHAQAVVIQVENYSNKILGDPQYYRSAGYDYDGRPNSIGPGAKDAFIYSDKDSNFVSCGGSVSWQIKEDTNGENGGKYSTGSNRGARISFSWYIDERYCSDSVYTPMQFEFHEKMYITEKGDWKNPSQKSIYNKHSNTMWTHSNHERRHYEAKHRRRIFLKELKPVFEARVIVTNGCKSIVRIQLLGIGDDTKLLGDNGGIPDIFEELIGANEEGTPMMTVLVMAGIGVAGIVLALIILKTSLSIHKKRKTKKQFGETEYRTVPTKDQEED